MTDTDKYTMFQHAPQAWTPRWYTNNVRFWQDNTTAAATEPLVTEDVYEMVSTMSNNRCLYLWALSLQQAPKP